MPGRALALGYIEYFLVPLVCGDITYSSWQLNPP